MRASDAKAHVGRRVIIRLKDRTVMGPNGTITAAGLVGTNLVVVTDKGIPRNVPIRGIERIYDFGETAR